MADSQSDTAMNAYTTHSRSILGAAWRLATRFIIAHEASVQKVPTPNFDATEVLVKVHCVALNVRTQQSINLWMRLTSLLNDSPPITNTLICLANPAALLDATMLEQYTA